MRNALKFRTAVFARHLAQAVAACLTMMTQGNLASITWHHWQVAMLTGVYAGAIGVVLTFGRFRWVQTNRWGVAAIAMAGTFVGDFLTHPTHFGGLLTEAVVTALGSGLLCLLVSYTAIGEAIERLGTIGVHGIDVSESSKRISRKAE